MDGTGWVRSNPGDGYRVAADLGGETGGVMSIA